MLGFSTPMPCEAGGKPSESLKNHARQSSQNPTSRTAMQSVGVPHDAQG